MVKNTWENKFTAFTMTAKINNLTLVYADAHKIGFTYQLSPDMMYL